MLTVQLHAHTKKHSQRPASHHPCNPLGGSHLCKYYSLHVATVTELPSLLHRPIYSPRPFTALLTMSSIYCTIPLLSLWVGVGGWQAGSCRCWLVGERLHLPPHQAALSSAQPTGRYNAHVSERAKDEAGSLTANVAADHPYRSPNMSFPVPPSVICSTVVLCV